MVAPAAVLIRAGLVLPRMGSAAMILRVFILPLRGARRLRVFVYHLGRLGRNIAVNVSLKPANAMERKAMPLSGPGDASKCQGCQDYARSRGSSDCVSHPILL